MDTKEKLLKSFGQHLAQLRRESGMSIHQLSHASGLEYSQVQRIEKGKVNLAFTTLIALMQGLESSPERFFKGFEPAE
jgi:transcriptional regulator with XRE-family HTH domain